MATHWLYFQPGTSPGTSSLYFALNAMLMKKVKRHNDSSRKREGGSNDHDVHDLMACPKKIKPPWVPHLRKLHTQLLSALWPSPWMNPSK